MGAACGHSHERMTARDCDGLRGNLVGNLLCTVVHLLDGPGLLASVFNLLDTINSLLGSL